MISYAGSLDVGIAASPNLVPDPWPIDDAWWQQTDPAAGRGRSARFQVVGVDGRAWLLVWHRDGWEVEAGYD